MNWKETFKIHLIKMNQYFDSFQPPIKNDIKVYLAGSFARYLDKEYISQIKPYIIDDLESFINFIKKFKYKLGNNAPIFYYAKINAEFKMFQLLENQSTKNIETISYYLHEPATLFSFASIYYRLAGKIYQSILFEIIYKRIKEIFSALELYVRSLDLEYKKKYDQDIPVIIEEIKDEEIYYFLENYNEKNDITIQDIKNHEIQQILSDLWNSKWN